MATLRVAVRGLGLVSTVILARLLVPEDFGLVAMATSLIAFLELATAFSFDIPLIQKQDADRRHFDSAWTLNALFYAGLTILLLALATPAAAFYDEERLTPVIYVLALGFFIKGFENIGVVYFRKELDFRKDFILLLSKKLLGFCVTIPLAFAWKSYWALVVGMVAGNLLGVVLTYYLHPYRPRFSFAMAADLMNFSKWLIFNNAISFLRMRSPDFIIGRVSGPAALGLFNISFEVSTMPTTEVVAPINRVVFPGYAKLATDPHALRQSYLDVLAIIALVALPAGVGLSSVAEPLIDIVLGDKWIEATPLVALLALFGAVNAIQTNTGSVYNAIGKPYLIAIIGSVNIAVLLSTAIWLAIHYGAIGVAAAYLGTSILMAPITFAILCHQIRLPFRSILSVLIRPIFGCGVLYASVVSLDDNVLIPQEFGSLGRLAILVLVGMFSYVVSTLGSWLLIGRPRSAEYRLAAVVGRALKTRITRPNHTKDA